MRSQWFTTWESSPSTSPVRTPTFLSGRADTRSTGPPRQESLSSFSKWTAPKRRRQAKSLSPASPALGKARSRPEPLSQLEDLARLTAKGPLGLHRALVVHVLLRVVDMVLALTTSLLGGQGLPEFALGLVLWCLIFLRCLILIGLHGRALRCPCARPRAFEGVVPPAHLASAHERAPG